MTLIKWNPTRKVKTTVPNLFDSFFNDDFFNLDKVFDNGVKLATKGSNVNITESDKDFGLEVALPGFTKDDFNVNVDGDLLTISAERKVENTDEDADRKYVRREFGYSSFSRSFHLPETVDTDSIIANYDNGILLLTLPKLEAEVKKVKTIEIS